MVPNSDNSAAGDYTCMVTVHAVASSESSAFTLDVAGIVTSNSADLKSIVGDNSFRSCALQVIEECLLTMTYHTYSRHKNNCQKNIARAHCDN